MQNQSPSSGFFEIGIDHPSHTENIGTLWRSAYQLGAAGIFSIGKVDTTPLSDTSHCWRHVPYRRYMNFESFKENLPFSTQLVAVECTGMPLSTFTHPDRCIYLLGSEHNGLSPAILSQCHMVVSIESIRTESYNVAIAGGIMMYHRLLQTIQKQNKNFSA